MIFPILTCWDSTQLNEIDLHIPLGVQKCTSVMNDTSEEIAPHTKLYIQNMLMLDFHPCSPLSSVKQKRTKYETSWYSNRFSIMSMEKRISCGRDFTFCSDLNTSLDEACRSGYMIECVVYGLINCPEMLLYSWKTIIVCCVLLSPIIATLFIFLLLPIIV